MFTFTQEFKENFDPTNNNEEINLPVGHMINQMLFETVTPSFDSV